MDAKDFALWRKKVGISQEVLAKRWAGVARATIQNWESGATPIPLAVAEACKNWERRFKQEKANLGPVTLCYTDGPMFVDAFRPRRLAMLQQEPFLTNAAAIRRVRDLWDAKHFYNPFIVEKPAEVLWNAAELQRVVNHEDKNAPTLPNLLVRLAQNIKDTSTLYVRFDAKLLTPSEAKERQRSIEALAKKFEALAEKEKETPIKYTQVEDVLSKLHDLGKTVPEQMLADIVQAFGPT